MSSEKDKPQEHKPEGKDDKVSETLAKSMPPVDGTNLRAALMANPKRHWTMPPDAKDDGKPRESFQLTDNGQVIASKNNSEAVMFGTKLQRKEEAYKAAGYGEPDEPLGTRIGSEEKIVSAAGIFREPEILKKDKAAANSIQDHKEAQHKPQENKSDVQTKAPDAHKVVPHPEQSTIKNIILRGSLYEGGPPHIPSRHSHPSHHRDAESGTKAGPTEHIPLPKHPKPGPTEFIPTPKPPEGLGEHIPVPKPPQPGPTEHVPIPGAPLPGPTEHIPIPKPPEDFGAIIDRPAPKPINQHLPAAQNEVHNGEGHGNEEEVKPGPQPGEMIIMGGAGAPAGGGNDPGDELNTRKWFNEHVIVINPDGNDPQIPEKDNKANDTTDHVEKNDQEVANEKRVISSGFKGPVFYNETEDKYTSQKDLAKELNKSWQEIGKMSQEQLAEHGWTRVDVEKADHAIAEKLEKSITENIQFKDGAITPESGLKICDHIRETLRPFCTDIDKRNIAFAFLDVNGKKEYLVSINNKSPSVPGLMPPVESPTEFTYPDLGRPRNNDSEAKLLEQIVKAYKDDGAGKVWLFSEQTPCPVSCENLIQDLPVKTENRISITVTSVYPDQSSREEAVKNRVQAFNESEWEVRK